MLTLDNIAKQLARTQGRRGALKVVAAAIVGAATVKFAQPTFASPPPPPHCDPACPSDATCVAGTCRCYNSAQVICGGVCTILNFDPNNCGGCGNVCPAGDECRPTDVNGYTTGQCTTPCHGQFVNTQNDRNNCGACGNQCPSNAGCFSGVCKYECSAGNWCTEEQSCVRGVCV